MPRPQYPNGIRKVDELGFPIPVTFEDYQNDRDEPRPAGRRWRFRIGNGIVLALLAVAVIVLLFGPQIERGVRRAVAKRSAILSQQSYFQGDLPNALSHIDRAIDWDPDSPRQYLVRAKYRLEAKDPAGCVEDTTWYIERASSDNSGLPDRNDLIYAYSVRSMALQRIERHREAVDDITAALNMVSENDASLLNHRAYTRAIGKLELSEGLADIERAIKMKGYPDAEFLDTRGYLRMLTGDHEGALVDLEQAIQLTERQRRQLTNVPLFGRAGNADLSRRLTILDHSLAVMYHHRGEIHDKLGNPEQSREDIQRGDQLGYDPAEGVY